MTCFLGTILPEALAARSALPELDCAAFDAHVRAFRYRIRALIPPDVNLQTTNTSRKSVRAWTLPTMFYAFYILVSVLAHLGPHLRSFILRLLGSPGVRRSTRYRSAVFC